MVSIVNEALYTALALAVLSYYIGVLVLALPVPLRGIKKWAPYLMQDGLLAALFVFIFSTIIDLVEYLRNLIGGSFDELLDYLKSLYANAFGYILSLKLIGTLISSAGLQPLTGILGPLFSVATLLFSLLGLTLILASIAASLKEVMIALGILLYSLPFRIGRAAGSTLIAFAMVMYIGLPLLPAWSTMIAGSIMPPSSTAIPPPGPVTIEGCIHGDYGAPGGAIVKFRDTVSGIEHEYAVDHNGCFIATGLSANHHYAVVVEYLSHELPTVPYSIETSEAWSYMTIEVYTPSIVYPHEGVLVYLSSCNNTVVEEHDSVINVLCSVKPGTELGIMVAYADACASLQDIGGYDIREKHVRDVEWFGYNITVIDMIGYSVKDNVSVSIKPRECRIQPSLQPSDVADEDVVLDVIVSIIWYWLTITVSISSYLALLVMITIGVARALGGYYVRLPIPV